MLWAFRFIDFFSSYGKNISVGKSNEQKAMENSKDQIIFPRSRYQPDNDNRTRLEDLEFKLKNLFRARVDLFQDFRVFNTNVSLHDDLVP